MKKLISLGFYVNEQSLHKRYMYPIHLACEAGKIAVVKSLVEDYGVDVSHTNNCYTDPPALCGAASNGRLEVLQYFLENGNRCKCTLWDTRYICITQCSRSNQSDVCEYLLSKGAEVDICNAYKATPLILAARLVVTSQHVCFLVQEQTLLHGQKGRDALSERSGMWPLKHD